ncbi:MAG: hypothetical protein HY700_05265, partial [Gemmatimonadetes bacterium]|nr:hypothetical protein [Gemmatimonadota bacterium]
MVGCLGAGEVTMAVQKRRTKSTAAEPETPLQASTAAENPPAFAQMVQPSDGLASALNQVSQSQPVAQPGSPPLVSARLHSDLWAREDQLGYALYAKSIAEFIHHRQTAPTLAIAVLAPWGRGKTTLMRLVQQQLVKKANRAPSSGAETGSPRTALRPQATFGDLRSWLKGRADFRPAKVRYPTVWFNAWKYESSEQVWAGLAHEILSQLVEQLPDQLEREKFWLMLQARRVDVAAVRRDLLGVLIEQFVGRLFTWSTLGLGGVALLAGGAAAWLAGGAAGLDFVSGGTVSGLGGLLIAVRKWMEGRAKPLDGAFARYVRRPDYEGKRGFLAEVEEDVRIAFDLLVSREEPAVVFVDDLDRCSPGKVADVIEALNLFLSGDFPGCYFVIGMDAQVVAASMEVAHKELTEKLQGLTRTHGSLGW